jgi:hypothetical protein
MEDSIKKAQTQLLDEKLWAKWTMNKVPTYVTKCPECDTYNVWSTTGLIIERKCKNCGEFFDPDV